MFHREDSMLITVGLKLGDYWLSNLELFLLRDRLLVLRCPFTDNPYSETLDKFIDLINCIAGVQAYPHPFGTAGNSWSHNGSGNESSRLTVSSERTGFASQQGENRRGWTYFWERHKWNCWRNPYRLQQLR